ncbi:hypothetical protein DWUX_1629 [Desulfovibrio diazotrophicus]|nr:hypothetical protein DWUX_1629 [Desulfovibrio diazotrophicus]
MIAVRKKTRQAARAGRGKCRAAERPCAPRRARRIKPDCAAPPKQGDAMPHSAGL